MAHKLHKITGFFIDGVSPLGGMVGYCASAKNPHSEEAWLPIPDGQLLNPAITVYPSEAEAHKAKAKLEAQLAFEVFGPNYAPKASSLRVVRIAEACDHDGPCDHAH